MRQRDEAAKLRQAKELELLKDQQARRIAAEIEKQTQSMLPHRKLEYQAIRKLVDNKMRMLSVRLDQIEALTTIYFKIKELTEQRA